MERPEMPKDLYELLDALTDLASERACELSNDADSFGQRLAAHEAQAIVNRSLFYIEEFSENYRNGDLK